MTCLYIYYIYRPHARRKRHELDIIVRNKYLRDIRGGILYGRGGKKWLFKYIGAARIFNGFFDDVATFGKPNYREVYIIHTHTYIHIYT